MELADLARWTPIRFDFSGPVPVVDWADLTAVRFVGVLKLLGIGSDRAGRHFDLTGLTPAGPTSRARIWPSSVNATIAW